MLVLAGLDPSGGAGLLADAEAVRSGGARPLCVATALTVQTTRAARRFEPVAAALFTDQVEALLEEEEVRAIKIGMIGSAPIGAAIAQLVARRPDLPVVLDPVLEASSGASLFAGPQAELRALLLLLSQGAFVTPNLAETVVLLGLRQEPRDEGELEAAALALRAKGARAALVKGGHLPGDPVDVLAHAGGIEHLRGARIGRGARGTGCRLASALAAGLACGLPAQEAARVARAIVRRYLTLDSMLDSPLSKE